jgi:plastocyanin
MGQANEPVVMKLMRRLRGSTRVLLILLALTTLTVAACSSSASAPKGSSANGATVISLKSLMFMPEDLKIKVGTRVTWRNDEPISHTVTSGNVTGVDKSTGLRTGQKPDGLFNATLKGNGDTFSYTFTKAGTYPYYCSIHYGMNANVIVTG